MGLTENDSKLIRFMDETKLTLDVEQIGNIFYRELMEHFNHNMINRRLRKLCENGSIKKIYNGIDENILYQSTTSGGDQIENDR